MGKLPEADLVLYLLAIASMRRLGEGKGMCIRLDVIDVMNGETNTGCTCVK